MNIFEDKEAIVDTYVPCVLRVGTLSGIFALEDIGRDGECTTRFVFGIEHVDTGERDPEMRPGYDGIYNAHFKAPIGSVVMMVPNAVRGDVGSQFFEVTNCGLQKLIDRDDVRRLLPQVEAA